MEKKLDKLYKECLAELKTIGIDINSELVGEIDVKISKRNNKRYGCCKQEDPDKNYVVKKKINRKVIINYEKFNKHNIEISKWVMELNEDIIKNTIIHELIHCMPYCNNHGKYFKKYARIINEKLGYNVSTRGNIERDYNDSGLEYTNNQKKYNYIIICKECGQELYRQRLTRNFERKYRCGKCKGRLKVNKIEDWRET